MCGNNKGEFAVRCWKIKVKQNGSMGGVVDKRSPSTSVTRVRFPYSPSREGDEFVVGSRPAPGVFLRVLRISSPPKTLLNPNSIGTLRPTIFMCYPILLRRLITDSPISFHSPLISLTFIISVLLSMI